MADKFPKFIAAAVQAAPVYLNREASIEKACSLIEQAAAEGAQFVVLPEVFIPGGPYWAWHSAFKNGLKYSVELYANSVEVPSAATERLGEVARKNRVFVVIGINEKDNKSIYNTLLFFDDEGNIIGKHRKLKPTGGEKLVWAEGDGSTHKVYDTKFGRVGGLICGEHGMALPGYTLAAMGEQVHVASWVGFATGKSFIAEICSRYHAYAFNTFVISSQSMVDQQVNQKLATDIPEGGAWTAIVAPGGEVLAGPLPAGQEGIVYAEIDLEKGVQHYFVNDSTGHYWPKQFRVLFDAEELKPLNFAGQKKTEECEVID